MPSSDRDETEIIIDAEIVDADVDEPPSQGVLRLGAIENPAEESRFARFQLIGWWDQSRLRDAKVLVIGAGAIGNELIKNLALLGIGRLAIADLDTVENSNLSRSILFRYEDCGRPKAEVAAQRAREIYPDLRAQALRCNIVYDLGLGIYRWADVILGGLDNREARVAINASAAKTDRVWIDGAIERLDGAARVFDPVRGPCYECTMGENDWKMLEARRSCALLTRGEMEQGRVPTTPTTASVIAGIQCQEAVKLLHGLDTLAGRGFVFEGAYHQSYVVEYVRKPDCPSHDPLEQIDAQDWSVTAVRAGDLLERARSDLGASAIVETNQDLLSGLECAQCGETEPVYESLGKVSVDRGRCPRCGEHRAPLLYHAIDGSDRSVLDRTLAELGVPLWDILSARAGLKRRAYEFAADRRAVLGPLASES